MENLNTLNATTTENTITTKKHFLPLDYLQELADESQKLTADEIDHHGFMATQYEQYGSINFKEYLKEVIFENMSDDDILRKYQEYLRECDRLDDDFYTLYDLDWLLEGMDPSDILRLGYYSENIYSSDYIRYNGYGNLEGVSEYELIREAKDDSDFMDWLTENSDNDAVQNALDDKDIIIQAALYLVSEGY